MYSIEDTTQQGRITHLSQIQSHSLGISGVLA